MTGALPILAMLAGASVAGEDAVRIRVENFTVTPSTGPVAHVRARNLGDSPFKGTISARFPEGWRVSPAKHQIDLAAHETKRLPFAIERGADLAANSYPVSVTIAGVGGTRVVGQRVVCASTPYYKPKIDGKLDEWRDAIPIAFTTAGKKTVVRSYWNRRQFCLAVEVEEETLIGFGKRSAKAGMDAIQFALSPACSVTSDDESAKAVRYEFLLADSGSWFTSDKCFRLLTAGDPLRLAKEPRALGPLELKDAVVAVKRSGEITRYEVAIPFEAMPSLRPTAGREYAFSLLVHDAAGAGLRDLGQVMNLSEGDRKRLAWCNWKNVKWNNVIPFDNKIEFGFCSSIH